MPPTLLRSSVGSLARCQSCSTIQLSSRSFSNSTPLSKIGPESPKFIAIPRAVQPHAVGVRSIKGKLPVPRNVFPGTKVDKTSIEYLASVTPEPVAPKSLAETSDPYINWKRNMAAKRRQNLREGILGLHERKVKTDRFRAKRSAFNNADRERRLHAPQREDERLMNSTIRAAMSSLQLGNLPDPNRERRVAQSQKNVLHKEMLMQDRRKTALHTLYMNARSFITTEEELDAQIEKIFVDRPFAEIPTKSFATNIWQALGPPPEAKDMLPDAASSGKMVDQASKGSAAITGKRMKKLAEALTGGKMD